MGVDLKNSFSELIFLFLAKFTATTVKQLSHLIPKGEKSYEHCNNIPLTSPCKASGILCSGFDDLCTNSGP